MSRGNMFAAALGVTSSIWVAAWLLTRRDPPIWPAMLLALLGMLLVFLGYRRDGWSRSSTAALVLCSLPWVIRIGGAL